MRGVYTVAQIQAAEHRAFALLTDGTLMQRAATALAQQCALRLHSEDRKIYGSSVVLLVGPGSNGGDALFAGAQLSRRGASVIALLADPVRRHEAGFAALIAAGGRASDGAGEEAIGLIQGADLVVDGLLGIGARPGLSPAMRRLARAAEPITTVAVDLPSGVGADTGVVDEAAVRADVTVTFGGLKAGLLIGAGAERAGAVHVVDIGLDLVSGLDASPAEQHAIVLENTDISSWLPRPVALDDKYRRGVVGVAAGSDRYGGAGVLSVGGARSGGAGMVRFLASSRAVATHVGAEFPDVVVHAGASPAELRVQAWVVGPGIGVDDAARDLLRSVLATEVPVLVDADGITLLAEELTTQPGLLRDRSAPTVLTPHDREFARIVGDVGADRVETARQAARTLGATVLLKGFATVVADPDGQVFLNPTGSAWLATAGSGDVLSGLIGSLLATGVSPTRAAALGSYVHGVAGQLAAIAGPPTAVEILQHLPSAVAAVRRGD